MKSARLDEQGAHPSAGSLGLAGSTSAARAFQANLQAGHTATEPNKGYGLRFEVPRFAGFRYESTTKEDGSQQPRHLLSWNLDA
ncbi:MAG TPA: hypothetical protein VLX28_11155, partial [Thermoanaerobaculia bacterium]|nr:hypothetical protein [Thermoanaerobaculia bacterium]